MFGRLFGKKPVLPSVPKAEMIVVQLNAKLQPMHRAEFFEDPLDAALQKRSLGEVSGGGTMQEKSGEIEYCDIELLVPLASEELLGFLIESLESLGAPRGSRLSVASSKAQHALGSNEGLAIYLNGVDLPVETYETCDSNFVHREFDRLLGDAGRVLSYWNGPTESAFYMYGPSFSAMKLRLADFLETYPLCQSCRIVQIA